MRMTISKACLGLAVFCMAPTASFAAEKSYVCAGRCQSKILNTWSGHRTAQIDPEKCRKINGREIRF
jgi:hypothetical protein